MPSVRPPIRDDADESLDELPPMDGEEGEDELDGFDTPLETDDGPVDFDDEELGGEAGAELQIEGAESGFLEGGESATELDVGDAIGQLDDEPSFVEDGDEGENEAQDFGLSDEPTSSLLDAGEEGPAGEEDVLSEDRLPSLGADDDEREEEAPESEEIFVDDEPPPWDDRAWDRAAVPLAVSSFTTVTTAPDGIIAAGRVLAFVGPSGASAILEATGLGRAEVRRARACGATLAVVTAEGRVHVSQDGGGHFSADDGWQTLSENTRTLPAVDVALEGEQLFVLDGAGQLFVRSGTGAWTSDRSLRALGFSTDGEHAWVLVQEAKGLVLQSLRSPTRKALPGLPKRVHTGVPVRVAARGDRVAVLAQGVGVFRLGAEGVWQRVSGTQAATAHAFLDEAGEMAVAIHLELDERSRILHVRADGEARTVAEVGESHAENDGRVFAMTWDESSRLLWAAGSFGVTAIAPPR